MDDKQCMDMAVKIQEIDSRSKSDQHRIDDLELEMDKMQETQIALVKLANGVDKMADQLVDMKSDIKEVKNGQRDLSNKVTTLENRPSQEIKQRWDTISDKLLWLFIAGVAGFLFASALPGIF